MLGLLILLLTPYRFHSSRIISLFVLSCLIVVMLLGSCILVWQTKIKITRYAEDIEKVTTLINYNVSSAEKSFNAQYVITGNVFDKAIGPVEGITVSLINSNRKTITDSFGNFAILFDKPLDDENGYRIKLQKGDRIKVYTVGIAQKMSVSWE